jgi:hypothetical protein
MPIVSSLPGYPQPFGSRLVNVVQYQGPTAYVQGGESLNATQFGWGSFDRVSGSDSVNANNSGNYSAKPRYPVSQASNSATGSQTVNIVMTAANGTEAANNTNLSGEYVRLELFGG